MFNNTSFSLPLIQLGKFRLFNRQSFNSPDSSEKGLQSKSFAFPVLKKRLKEALFRALEKQLEDKNLKRIAGIAPQFKGQYFMQKTKTTPDLIPIFAPPIYNNTILCSL
ncbi:hypothetical protein [Flavobacterium sp. Arc2]|uniref:hypothetical protein n=1 Tax=Flavobacterium sp. Arc2 TaxID=3046685 RepID=UPI00352CE909